MSGGGTLYVHSQENKSKSVSAVDKENGSVVRILNTSKADKDNNWFFHAHENVLLVVEWRQDLYKSVHVYENEVQKRSLQLEICLSFRNRSVLSGRDYLLLQLDKVRLAILDTTSLDLK